LLLIALLVAEEWRHIHALCELWMCTSTLSSLFMQLTKQN